MYRRSSQKLDNRQKFGENGHILKSDFEEDSFFLPEQKIAGGIFVEKMPIGSIDKIIGYSQCILKAKKSA